MRQIGITDVMKSIQQLCDYIKMLFCISTRGNMRTGTHGRTDAIPGILCKCFPIKGMLSDPAWHQTRDNDEQCQVQVCVHIHLSPQHTSTSQTSWWWVMTPLSVIAHFWSVITVETPWTTWQHPPSWPQTLCDVSVSRFKSDMGQTYLYWVINPMWSRWQGSPVQHRNQQQRADQISKCL